jgi:hypothetical protein
MRNLVLIKENSEHSTMFLSENNIQNINIRVKGIFSGRIDFGRNALEGFGCTDVINIFCRG